jgi:hypothetical protein
LGIRGGGRGWPWVLFDKEKRFEVAEKFLAFVREKKMALMTKRAHGPSIFHVMLSGLQVLRKATLSSSTLLVVIFASGRLF